MLKIIDGKVQKQDKIILKDINIEIKAHTIYQISGKNASGKSSLCDVLSGFEKLDSGSFTSDFNKIIQVSEQSPFYDDELVLNILKIYADVYKTDIKLFKAAFLN